MRSTPRLGCSPRPRCWDWDSFRRDGYAAVDFIADYHTALQTKTIPVQSHVKPGFLAASAWAKAFVASASSQAPAPRVLSTPEHLDFVRDRVLPGLLHWQHPNFLGYFPAMTSPSALLGDMVGNALGTPGFSWEASPAATELELVVTDWFAEALGLPERFKWSGVDGAGTLQPTATESVIVVMTAARDKALANAKTYARKRAHETELGRLVCYTSDQAHFGFEKAARVVGVQHIRKLPTAFSSRTGNIALDPDTLSAQLAVDRSKGLIPFFIQANFGTTGTCAVDPLELLASLAKEYGCWFHIDAAYAGAALICPEFRTHLPDPVLACTDSLVINGSKWLSMSFNCSFLYCSNRVALRSSFSAGADYVKPASQHGAHVDLKDYQLGLGRPFRAMKVLAVAQTHGLAEMRSVILKHVSLAQYLEGLIQDDSAFELLTRSCFALVVFRLRGVDSAGTRRYANSINETGRAFVVTTTVLGGEAIRIALSSAVLDKSDVRELFLLLTQALPCPSAT